NRKIARPAHSCSQPASRQNDQDSAAAAATSRRIRSLGPKPLLHGMRANLTPSAGVRLPGRSGRHWRGGDRLESPPGGEGTTMLRWFWRIALLLAALVALLALLGWWLLCGSLPALDGRLALAGLSAPVEVQRDALG